MSFRDFHIFGHILGLFWAYFGLILGLFEAYFEFYCVLFGIGVGQYLLYGSKGLSLGCLQSFSIISTTVSMSLIRWGDFVSSHLSK